MAYDRYDRDTRWREGRRDFSSDRSLRDWDRGDDRDRDYSRGGEDRGFLERMQPTWSVRARCLIRTRRSAGRSRTGPIAAG